MKFHVIPYVPVRTGQGFVAEAPVWREGPEVATATAPGAAGVVLGESQGPTSVRRGFDWGDGPLCLDIHEST